MSKPFYTLLNTPPPGCETGKEIYFGGKAKFAARKAFVFMKDREWFDQENTVNDIPINLKNRQNGKKVTFVAKVVIFDPPKEITKYGKTYSLKREFIIKKQKRRE